MYLKHALIFGVVVVLSLLLNRLMLRWAPLLGLMDQPGERRIHAKAIPRAGGLAIWLAFMATVGGVVGMGLFPSGGLLSWSWFGAFAAGSGVLMTAGIMDDRFGLRPLVKLGAHALAPTVYFIIRPVDTGMFPDGWPVLLDFGVFLVWVVVLINAFNLIDGLDGLCGGLAAVSAIALAAMAYVNGRADSAALLLVMTGAIFGFLRYNINPARIFLGDAGSMLMGFFLATAATDAVGRRAVVGAVLLPIAVAGVPLLDVLLAIWRRGARRLVRKLRGEDVKGGIFEADSEHLHHRLLAAAGSQRKVASVLHGIAILLAGLAFLPMLFGDRVIGLTLVGFIVVAMVGVRNLARIEIEHTGNMVHLAIKLPSHRRRIAAVLFLYDVLVLALSGIAAVIIETNFLTRGQGMLDLWKFVIVFTVLGSISTLLVRIHHRLWVRATIRDILSLQFWLMAAALGTFALFCVVFRSMEWSGLRLAVMSYVFASVGVSTPRVFLDLLREFGLEARHRSHRAPTSAGHGPVVVIGAGDMGTLFLDHLKSSAHDIYPGMTILGFIDETRVLHGRKLRSFRILGGLSAIPKLVEEGGLKGVVIAIGRPRSELLEQIEALAADFNLRVYRWRIDLAEESMLGGTTATKLLRPKEVAEPPVLETLEAKVL